MASRRIGKIVVEKQLKKLIQVGSEHYQVKPNENKDDWRIWEVRIYGPRNTPYENGIFVLNVKFSNDYPKTSPNVTFVTPIFHINVSRAGKICCEELDFNGWLLNDFVGMDDIFESIYNLLKEPDPSGSIFDKALILFVENKKWYDEIARSWTKTYAFDNEHSVSVNLKNSSEKNILAYVGTELTPNNKETEALEKYQKNEMSRESLQDVFGLKFEKIVCREISSKYLDNRLIQDDKDDKYDKEDKRTPYSEPLIFGFIGTKIFNNFDKFNKLIGVKPIISIIMKYCGSRYEIIVIQEKDVPDVPDVPDKPNKPPRSTPHQPEILNREASKNSITRPIIMKPRKVWRQVIRQKTYWRFDGKDIIPIK